MVMSQFGSSKNSVPKARVCCWVAQWFTIPQAVVKTLQFVSIYMYVEYTSILFTFHHADSQCSCDYFAAFMEK